MQSYILNPVQSTSQHLQMNCLHNRMNAIIFPILQVRKQSTERLGNLPEITQQVGSRARMRTRLAGTRGQKCPLEHIHCAQCNERLRCYRLCPSVVYCSGQELQSIWKVNKIWQERRGLETGWVSWKWSVRRRCTCNLFVHLGWAEGKGTCCAA